MKIKSIILVCICMFCASVVYADSIDTQIIETVSEEKLKYINMVIDEISTELRKIDLKFDNARITNQYENYPLIRLSIDTPYFGIVSITENKLKIKDTVSNIEGIKGYNIRSAINSRTIVIKDINESSLIQNYKKIKISENMTELEADMCLENLIYALEQVRNTSNFVDVQLNTIFKEYITESKKIDIQYIKSELNIIEENLDICEENIVKLNLNSNEQELIKIEEFILNKDKYSKMISNYSTDESVLESNIPNVIELKNNVNLYNEELNLKLEEVNKNIDINKLLLTILEIMNKDIEYLDSAIKLTMYNEENTESSEILSFDQKYITSCNKYIYELQELYDSNKYAAENTETMNLLLEADKIYSVYLEFLNAYNVALTQYVRVYVTLLKDYSITDMIVDEEYMYLYLDLEDEITTVADAYDKDSMYSSRKCIESIKNIINKLVLLEDNVKEGLI